jgi:hypothetical protein
MSYYSRIRAKYPGRCPLIIERRGSTIPQLKKYKFIVPFDLTFSQLMYTVRKQFDVDPAYGIFMMVGGEIVRGGEIIGSYDNGTVIKIILCSEYVFG